MKVTVRDIERAVADRFPVERAESWDRCGLSVGDAAADVRGVALALDPTRGSVRAAAAAGANVLVTHHPPYLDPPQRITPGGGAGGVVFEAASSGIAIINAHTNLDRDTEAQLLIVDALGFSAIGPLETGLAPMALVTVFVPDESADSVRHAMAKAGAGSIGAYEGCSFTLSGTGEFTPREGARPATGSVGERTTTGELRVEMIAPKSKAAAVAGAAAGAHPYEEPVIVVNDIGMARNAARLGHLSSPPAGTTVSSLAATASSAFGVRAKVYGDPEKLVTTVATTTGSGTSMLGPAKAAGAQAVVLGEVRYHDALDAAGSGLAVIELGHDVTEWPLVGLLEQVVLGVPGLDRGLVHRLPADPAWWTT